MLIIDNAANIVSALIDSSSSLDFTTSTTSTTMTDATVNDVTMQPNLFKELHTDSNSSFPVFLRFLFFSGKHRSRREV